MQAIEWFDGLTLHAVEGALLKSALIKHRYDIKATARALGVCRATVYKKTLSHFGVSMPEIRRKMREHQALAIAAAACAE